MPGRLTITSEELSRPDVDARLARQQESERAAAEQTVTAPLVPATSAGSFWYNALVYMSLFGLLGGAVGWSFGELLHLRPNAQVEARELIDAHKKVAAAARATRLTEIEASAALAQLRRAGRNNAYFLAWSDPALSDAQRQQRLEEIEKRQAWRDFLANVLFYGMSGMMIAACLGMADAVMSRNVPLAVANGILGAALGLAGGIVVSLFVDRLYTLIAGSIDADVSMGMKMLGRAVSWGVLGSFLSVAPGLMMRNTRSLLVGIGGGLVGGIVGGLVFDPIASLTEDQHMSRLVGMAVIGLVSGLATGLIESAAKTGWLKVTAGWIAGKQFIVYRNPTYIGSSLQCSVYLFKDPQVGRRHAAVHIVPGGFEIEDLPLGGKTLVNGRAIQRARLRSGDRIQIGATSMMFHQKAQGA